MKLRSYSNFFAGAQARHDTFARDGVIGDCIGPQRGEGAFLFSVPQQLLALPPWSAASVLQMATFVKLFEPVFQRLDSQFGLVEKLRGEKSSQSQLAEAAPQCLWQSPKFVKKTSPLSVAAAGAVWPTPSGFLWLSIQWVFDAPRQHLLRRNGLKSKLFCGSNRPACVQGDWGSTRLGQRTCGADPDEKWTPLSCWSSLEVSLGHLDKAGGYLGLPGEERAEAP